MAETHETSIEVDGARAGDMASDSASNRGVSVSDARSGNGADAQRNGNGLITPIPGSIVKAICAVMVTVEAITKTQFNRQGNYKFASADDIYAAVARKFGEVGLMIYPLEMRPPEIKRVEKTDKDGELKVSQWGQFCFGYVLATEEATWFDPRSSRTIFIQILGPQTFNAAESYCQKQYLRALLKLPTGDMDLDSMPQGDTEEEQIATARKPKAKSSAAAKKDGTDTVFNDLSRAIENADGPADLADIKSKNLTVWESMPARWRELLDDAFDCRMQEFEQMEAAQ